MQPGNEHKDSRSQHRKSQHKPQAGAEHFLGRKKSGAALIYGKEMQIVVNIVYHKIQGNCRNQCNDIMLIPIPYPQIMDKESRKRRYPHPGRQMYAIGKKFVMLQPQDMGFRLACSGFPLFSMISFPSFLQVIRFMPSPVLPVQV